MKEIYNHLAVPLLENNVRHLPVVLRVSESAASHFFVPEIMTESNFQREEQQCLTPFLVYVWRLFVYNRTAFVGQLREEDWTGFPHTYGT